MVIALLFYTLGIILCAIFSLPHSSSSLWSIQFILFHFIKGFGAGLLMTHSMIILGNIIPIRKRSQYFSNYCALFALASFINKKLPYVDRSNYRFGLLVAGIPSCIFLL